MCCGPNLARGPGFADRWPREMTGPSRCLPEVTSRSQSRLSAFDEAVLNLPQFVQLTETFLGDAPERKVIQRLVAYVSEGYVETEDERLERIIKVRFHFHFN